MKEYDTLRRIFKREWQRQVTARSRGRRIKKPVEPLEKYVEKKVRGYRRRFSR